MALARALPPQNHHQSCPNHRCSKVSELLVERPLAWLALVQQQQEQEQKLEAPGMALARALPPQNHHQSCPTHRCLQLVVAQLAQQYC